MVTRENNLLLINWGVPVANYTANIINYTLVNNTAIKLMLTNRSLIISITSCDGILAEFHIG